MSDIFPSQHLIQSCLALKAGPAKDPFVNSDFPPKTRQERSANDSDMKKLLLSVSFMSLMTYNSTGCKILYVSWNYSVLKLFV
jgi:hypothetical protein